VKRMLRKSLNRSKQMVQSWLGVERVAALRAYRQFWSAHLQGKELVFVHTMGKVASSSITQSLRASPVGNRLLIYHTHSLSPTGMDLVRRWFERAAGGPEKLPDEVKIFLQKHRVVSEQLAHHYRLGRRVKVISLVRDAVATNLSGYFYTNHCWPPFLREAAQQRQPRVMPQLRRHFLAAYPHDLPAFWFDVEMRDVFGVDVYEEPFPQGQGWQIYRSARADLLLLKLDRLNEVADVAFSAFMDLPHFALVRVNEAEEQWYAPLYQEFTRWVSLPEAYLVRMYESRYTRHFYSPAEIDHFRQRWTKALPQPIPV
jgi:hypothetical protein